MSDIIYKHPATGREWHGGNIIVDGRRIVNPRPEHLLAAGYEAVEVPEPTEEERSARQEARSRALRMQQIEAELQAMDYLTSKAMDGEDMTAYDRQYGGDWHAYRRQLRQEYRQLRGDSQ